MAHTNFVMKMKKEASRLKLLEALAPSFTILEEGLPMLNEVILELRGDETTNADFQGHIIELLEKHDYSARNLCGLMYSYSKTHNDSNTPGRKPVVAIAQQAQKIITAIDSIFDSMKDLETHSQYVAYRITQKQLGANK